MTVQWAYLEFEYQYRTEPLLSLFMQSRRKVVYQPTLEICAQTSVSLTVLCHVVNMLMALRCIVLLIFFNLPLCHGLCKALPFFAVHPPKNLQQFCAKITKILSRNWIQFYRVLLVLCIVIHAASFLVDCGTVAPHFAPSHHIKKKVRHHS